MLSLRQVLNRVTSLNNWNGVPKEMDSELRGIVSVSLSILLLLGLTRAHIPKVYTSPDKLPSDGDAWTENNNATYPWVISPSYPDDIGFTSQEKKIGSYSLEVNHATTQSYMAFYVDIGQETDLTGYDVIVFWFKIVRSSWTSIVTLSICQTTPWSGNKYNYKYFADDNQWNRAVFPLEAFTESSSPSWENRRHIAFQVAGVSSGDNAKVYIDGIYFTNWSTITETTSLNELWMPNYESFLHRWTKTQTYQGKSYTSTWSMVPISGHSDNNPSLESEALAQIVYGLMIAYNYSKIQHYLDTAKPYVDWLIKFQYSGAGRRNGGFWNQYSGGSFTEGTGSTFAGWQLGALSYCYSLTGNCTIKTVSDNLRRFIVDTLWNDTNKWFDSLDLATDVKSYRTSWDGMGQGSVALGLALYYKYVSQNSTVKTVLDELLNKGLGLTQNHNFYRGTANYEDSMYAWWGYYWAYKATNNGTYYNEALKAIKLTRTNYEQNLNGSQWFNTYMINTTGGFDGWGFACSLPLLFILHEQETNSQYLELFKNQLFDLLPTIKTGNYSITRKRDSGDDWVNWQYTPSNAFMVAALTQYYAKIYKPTNPYLLSTDKEITSSSFANDKLTFTVSNTNFAGATSTTMVYCGDKGEPTAVYATNGTLTWSYDTSTTILTLNVTHLSPAEIVVYWRFPGDIDGDGDVDSDDFYIFAGAYGASEGDPNYNSDADLDGDGNIDSSDFYIFAKDYGKTET